MDAKQIEITCPCCGSRVLVDVRTEQVLRTRPVAEPDREGRPKVGEADWDEACGRVRTREEQREDRLDSALERERERGSTLDERFRRASEKLAEEE